MCIAVGAKLVNDVYSGISFENNLQFEVYDCNNNSSVDDTADVSKSLDTPVKVEMQLLSEKPKLLTLLVKLILLEEGARG